MRTGRSNNPRELLAVGILGPTSRLGDRIEMLLRHGRAFSPRASIARVVVSALVLLALVVAGSLAPRWIAFAQQPAFEVTTVRPSKPSDRGIMNHFDAERVSYTDTPLKVLIQAAYNVRDYQISGGPAWLSSDKWDVAGKLENPIVDRQQRYAVENQMLQTLLADRFKLSVHRETREITEYSLVVAKNGPKIHEVKNGEADSRPAGIRTGRGLLDAHKMPLAQLSFWLGVELGLPVLDGTGLVGDYDFKVEWVPDESQPNSGGIVPPADSAGPSIFAAVQEQLGLRLESLKGPVEILVIDHVEKPSEN